MSAIVKEILTNVPTITNTLALMYAYMVVHTPVPIFIEITYSYPNEFIVSA